MSGRVGFKSGYEHLSPPGVTIAFEKVLKEGAVSIQSYRDCVPPGIPKLDGVNLYYVINTTIVSEGRIEIRILAPISDPEIEGKILEWRDDEWIDRTVYSVKVGHYRLIVGVTDHLSGFGIRT